MRKACKLIKPRPSLSKDKIRKVKKIVGSWSACEQAGLEPVQLYSYTKSCQLETVSRKSLSGLVLNLYDHLSYAKKNCDILRVFGGLLPELELINIKHILVLKIKTFNLNLLNEYNPKSLF